MKRERGDLRGTGPAALYAGGDRGRQRRQAVFLEALETLAGAQVHYGHYLSKPRECRSCGARWTVYEEKMTDANIAVRILGDAQDDLFDTAILVSADGDLAGPVEAVLDRCEDKRVVAVFPPGRRSDRLRGAATAGFTVRRKVAFAIYDDPRGL